MPCNSCSYEVSNDIVIVDPVDPESCDYYSCWITLLRTHLGDFSGVYSDDRLAQLIGAAQFATVIDLACCEIVTKPAISTCGFSCVDPSEYPQYTLLTTLQAACIANRGEARAKSLSEGITARCGSASLAVSSGSSYLKALDTGGACAAYKELKEELCWKNPVCSAQYAFQIVGSFSSKNLSGECCTSNWRSDCN